MAGRFTKSPTFLGIVGTGVFVLAWEGISRSGLVNEIMLPAPSVVLRSGFDLLRSGELVNHFAASVGRALTGFVIGAVLAILLGIAMARLTWLYGLLNPLVQMLRAIPSLAFVPLAIFWFGIGESSKIFLIAFGVFFPVWVNTYLGVRDANPTLIRAAASLGASGWRMLFFVILPGALPFILAGLKISLSIAMVLVVAAELAGAMAGVGYLIQLSQQVFRVDHMFVGLLTLGVMGYFADVLFDRTVQWLLPWYGVRTESKRKRRREAAQDGLGDSAPVAVLQDAKN